MDRPIEVLLVEDNPADVELTRKALADGKIRNTVHVARDGFAALEFLRREGSFSGVPRPDLILLDLTLPGMDGLEVLAKLKHDAELRTIPVIVLSSSNSDADVEETYRLHASCFIRKPVNYAQFSDVVRTLEGFWFQVVRLP
jgi:chemotaxis family two-component system response regulator Rcp1